MSAIAATQINPCDRKTIKVKAYITIKQEKCKGCQLCVASCNQGLISADEGAINALGYTPMKFDDPDGKCKACKLCAEMCPDVCIRVFREKKTQE